jgi:predicted TPR repeat methyltransferase
MPFSARENDYYVQRFVMDEGIRTVLDIGAGSGTYANLLGNLVTIDAVEIWDEYIRKFQLENKYRTVYEMDVRDCSRYSPAWGTGHYDLVVFGDVLEHMSEEESKSVWDWASTVADWGLISVPVVHWPQGEAFNNPYEVHVQEDFDLEPYGPFTYEQRWNMTGTFIKDFR